MDRKLLEYSYPEKLVALEPKEPCRVLLMDKASHKEIELKNAFSCLSRGDVRLTRLS